MLRTSEVVDILLLLEDHHAYLEFEQKRKIRILHLTMVLQPIPLEERQPESCSLKL